CAARSEAHASPGVHQRSSPIATEPHVDTAMPNRIASTPSTTAARHGCGSRTTSPSSAEGSVSPDIDIEAAVVRTPAASLDQLDDIEHRQVERDDHAADANTHHDDQERFDQ